MFGVNLIGYIRAEMGLGTAARGLAHALDSVAIPFNIINFEHGNPSLHRDRSWSHKEVATSSYDFTILVVNPDNIAASSSSCPVEPREHSLFSSSLVIMAVAFAVILPFAFWGLPSGHDFEFHVNSFFQFCVANLDMLLFRR